MVQKLRRPTLPQDVLRAITVGQTISAIAAQRQADKADYEAYIAHLDGRKARARELRKRAQTLRKLADKVSAQGAGQPA